MVLSAHIFMQGKIRAQICELMTMTILPPCLLFTHNATLTAHANQGLRVNSSCQSAQFGTAPPTRQTTTAPESQMGEDARKKRQENARIGTMRCWYIGA